MLANRDGKSDYQRSITLDSLTWAEDGTMNTVARSQGVVAQLKAGNARQLWEAEKMAFQSGVETAFAEDGGQRVGVKVTETESGDWIGYSQLDLGTNASSFRARIASATSGAATIELMLDGCDGFTEEPGTLLASCEVSPTGGWNSWQDLVCEIPNTSGVHDLCLRFAGGSGALVDVDYFQFE